jgi:Na+-transporting NADH:ubiquinone oxidoreductase subunit NqrE
MAGIRNKLQDADIPEPLQGLGSTVIITGIMALAFMGFTGMVELG